ncbi:MAG: hypothetical protein ABI970_23590, partial [Chloroflexota bacterium]
MARFYFRFGPFVFSIFSALLLLIHAQPYDLHENRQRFVRDDCSAACFVGIQPGITSVEEAVQRLEASGWTSEVDNRTINNVSGFISWKWSDKKPAWISGDTEGNIWASQKQVVRIVIYGDLQLGDTRLTLGLPDQEEIDTNQDRKHVFSLYTATYAQAGLIIQSWQPCNVLEPLRRPVILTYTLSASPALFPAQDAL